MVLFWAAAGQFWGNPKRDTEPVAGAALLGQQHLPLPPSSDCFASVAVPGENQECALQTCTVHLPSGGKGWKITQRFTGSRTSHSNTALFHSLE